MGRAYRVRSRFRFCSSPTRRLRLLHFTLFIFELLLEASILKVLSKHPLTFQSVSRIISWGLLSKAYKSLSDRNSLGLCPGLTTKLFF